MRKNDKQLLICKPLSFAILTLPCPARGGRHKVKVLMFSRIKLSDGPTIQQSPVILCLDLRQIQQMSRRLKSWTKPFKVSTVCNLDHVWWKTSMDNRKHTIWGVIWIVIYPPVVSIISNEELLNKVAAWWGWWGEGAVVLVQTLVHHYCLSCDLAVGAGKRSKGMNVGAQCTPSESFYWVYFNTA